MRLRRILLGRGGATRIPRFHTVPDLVEVLEGFTRALSEAVPELVVPLHTEREPVQPRIFQERHDLIEGAVDRIALRALDERHMQHGQRVFAVFIKHAVPSGHRHPPKGVSPMEARLAHTHDDVNRVVAELLQALLDDGREVRLRHDRHERLRVRRVHLVLHLVILEGVLQALPQVLCVEFFRSGEVFSPLDDVFCHLVPHAERYHDLRLQRHGVRRRGPIIESRRASDVVRY